MSTFSCPVVCVSDVIEHPNADRLSVIKLAGLGYTCISAKLEDGSPRYKVGDWVVYIPSSSVMPEWLLRRLDMWNDTENKGFLDGSLGNRVGPRKLRGIFSEGVLYKVDWDDDLSNKGGGSVVSVQDPDNADMDNLHQVELGDDVSKLLGITKYEPPIPVHMAGEVANLHGHTIKYDFERLETIPDIFVPGEQVYATEKLHGTFVAIVYVPGLNHPEMFGETGDIIVHSKGLGAQGLAFKNNAANDGNLYVKTLRSLLDAGLEQAFRTIDIKATRYAILGEIYGRGVQDLHYGTSKPEFRVFDMLVGDEYLTQDEIGFHYAIDPLVKTAPILYNGSFNLEELEKIRDGKTTVGGDNIREGIVVRSKDSTKHVMHGRRIAKLISPGYLLRKSKEATEYN